MADLMVNCSHTLLSLAQFIAIHSVMSLVERLSLFQRSVFAHTMTTVEPLNEGHIGTHSVVPCREAVLVSEVSFTHTMTTVVPLNEGHIGISWES